MKNLFFLIALFFSAQVLPAQISVSLQTIDPVCHGGGGWVKPTVSNTTPGQQYTFLWSNGRTNKNINVLAGTYTVTVTATNGQTASATATLFQPDLLTIALSVAPTEVSVFSGGGTPGYLYIIDAPNTQTPPPQSSNIFTGLTPSGTYIFRVQDVNGCKKSKMVKLPSN